MKCFHCGSLDFRTSRLRRADVRRLFYFQYPLRCRFCHERIFVDLLTAWRIHLCRSRRRADPSSI
jgi:hypothetical protein